MVKDFKLIMASFYHINTLDSIEKSNVYRARVKKSVETDYKFSIKIKDHVRELGNYLNENHARAFWIIARRQDDDIARLISSEVTSSIAKAFLSGASHNNRGQAPERR